MFKWVLAALLVVWAAPAIATETVTYGPAASWVKPQAAEAGPSDAVAEPARISLQNVQVRYSAGGVDTFNHTVLQILSPEGLALGNLALSWDPDTDDVVIHHVLLRRAGAVALYARRGPTPVGEDRGG